jgi:hypothetical protein
MCEKYSIYVFDRDLQDCTEETLLTTRGINPKYKLLTWNGYPVQHYMSVDDGNGQPSVEFINYNGYEGFKLYFEVLEVAGGLGWVFKPHSDNYNWEDISMVLKLSADIVIKVEETENSVIKEESAEANTLPVWALAVIAGGVIVVAVGVVLIIKKSRK